jgi:hypothetical protein
VMQHIDASRVAKEAIIYCLTLGEVVMVGKAFPVTVGNPISWRLYLSRAVSARSHTKSLRGPEGS